jgi:rhodanese-related sulfurtransferase
MAAPASPLLHPDDLTRLRTANPKTRLLDVRTPAEFASQHIVGAYNVPLDTLAEHGAEIRAGVTDPVVLVCRSGQRARKAEEALRATGMANLHILDGGMAAWTAAGQPVREGKPRMSLERQVRIAAGALAAIGGVLGVFVSPLFAVLPALVGSGLVFSGVTDTCGMGTVLAVLPHNRPPTCDVPAMVRALTAGVPPTANQPAWQPDTIAHSHP